MDDESDWNATTFFSPSKARVQQAQAKDWAVVDAWLSKKYSSKRLPTFERNEETLETLLTLATVNENADEQRGYLERIEKAALSAHAKRRATSDPIYLAVTRTTSASPELATLAECALALNCSDADASALAESILDLTTRAFTLNQQLRRVEAQADILKQEQSRVIKNLEAIKQDAFIASPDIAEQNAEWTRGSKHMRAKLAEYDERLSTSTLPHSSDAYFNSVRQQKQDLDADADRIANLNAQLQSFQALPTNTKAAYTKVETARKDLIAFSTQRDRLFASMAESG